MKRMGMRALAMSGALVVVLMAGDSAQAWRLRDFDRDGERLRYREWTRDWSRDRDRERDRWWTRFWTRDHEHSHTRWCGHRDEPQPGPAIPEPSAALVFGVGLLVARGFARRNR